MIKFGVITLIFLLLLEFFVWKPEFFVLGAIILVGMYGVLLNILLRNRRAQVTATLAYTSAFTFSFADVLSLLHIVSLLPVAVLMLTIPIYKEEFLRKTSSIKTLLLVVTLFFWIGGIYRLVIIASIPSAIL